MELLKLKKRSTPDHYYFLRRKNNYIDKKGIIKVTYKELPFFVVKRYKLDVRNSIHFQSREDYIKEFNVLNSFQEYSSKFINNDNKLISGRKFKEKRYKFLYNKFKKLNYVLKKRSGSYLFFKDLINNYKRRKKEERVNKYMPLYNNLNSEIKKKKNF